MAEGRECSIEEFEDAVDRIIAEGDREKIWELKDVCMQALYYGKHTFPEKMVSMKRCLDKLEQALIIIDKGREEMKKKSREK
jgi:hypothetical protein